MERQFVVAQLPILLEKRTSQHRLGGQALPPGGLDAEPHQVTGHHPKQIAMLVEPLRHRLQLVADLMRSENVEYAGLDGAFLAHFRSGGDRTLASSGMIQNTGNRRILRFHKQDQSFVVYGRKLASLANFQTSSI